MKPTIDPILVEKIDIWTKQNRQRLIEDLARLVRIRSVSEKDGTPPYGAGCRRALDEMLAIGREHGFTGENYDYHCASLYLDDDPEKQTIGLWGHLDVVPEGDGWDYDPYEPTLKDGWMIGRGAQDNKGPSIANLYLLQCIRELGVPMQRNLRLYVGCDEENGMQDLAYFTKNCRCPDLSIITDSGFPVCYGEKGILNVNLRSQNSLSKEITALWGGRASNIVPDAAGVCLAGKKMETKGISKHTAFPEDGVNAIALLCAQLSQKEGLAPADQALFAALTESHQDFAGTGLGIRCSDELSGALTCVGSMIFLQEQHLVQHYNIRYPIHADADKLKQIIRNWATTHGFSVQIIRDSKPNDFPKEHPAVSLLTDCYNELEQADKEPFVMGGGTYARMLPHAFAFGMGLSTAEAPQIFAPGHGDCHSPDEGQYIDNLLRAVKIMIIGLVNLDEVEI